MTDSIDATIRACCVGQKALEAAVAICDVCNASSMTSEEGKTYTAEEFRQLVARGFEPDLSIIDQGALVGLTRQQAVEAWKEALVARSTTDWLLCPICAARAAECSVGAVVAGPSGGAGAPASGLVGSTDRIESRTGKPQSVGPSAKSGTPPTVSSAHTESPHPSADTQPGSYIERQLESGERLVYRTRLHWIKLVRAGIEVLFGSLGVWLIWLYSERVIGLSTSLGLPEAYGRWPVYFLLLVSAAALLVALSEVISYFASEIGVTNRRVVGRVGGLIRRGISIPIAEVARVEAGAEARKLFNQGNVVLSTTEGRRHRLSSVARPSLLKARIESQLAPGLRAALGRRSVWKIVAGIAGILAIGALSYATVLLVLSLIQEDGGAAEYVAVLPTSRVSPTPVAPTATPVPPTPVQPTPTPVPPTLAASCVPDVDYVQDVTVPDGAEYGAGEYFTKVWRVRSSGCIEWPPGSRWVFVSGDKMGAPDWVEMPETVLGVTADLSVPMEAPAEPGTYRGFWQMEDPDGVRYGSRVYVEIVVPVETPQPPTCPNDPALVSIINELGTQLTLILSGPRGYHLTIQAGQTVNICLEPGTYEYTATSEGFEPDVGSRTLEANVLDCWWWYVDERVRPPCDAPTDPAAYSPPR